MKIVLTLIAWVYLIPLGIACLVAPSHAAHYAGGAVAATPFAVAFGVACLTLGAVNLRASGSPSVWKPTLLTNALFLGGVTVVPLVSHLYEVPVAWPWWASSGVAFVGITALTAAAVWTFWMD